MYSLEKREGKEKTVCNIEKEGKKGEKFLILKYEVRENNFYGRERVFEI